MRVLKSISFIVILLGWSTLAFAQKKLEGIYYSTEFGMKVGVQQGRYGLELQYESLLKSGTAKCKAVNAQNTVFEYTNKEGQTVRIDFTNPTYVRELRLDDKGVIKKLRIWSKKSRREAKKVAKSLKKTIGQVDVINPVSEFHKKNLFKYTFFESKPVFGKETEAKPKTTFKLGEAVWALYFLPYEGAAGGEKLRLYLKEGDDKRFLNNYKLAKDKPENFHRFSVMPALSNIADKDLKSHRDMLKVFSSVQPGTYDFLVDIDEKHKGSFKLECTTKGIAQARALYEKILDSEDLPKARTRNRNLETWILHAMNTLTKKRGGKQKYVKAIIYTSAWGIHKNRLGQITGRSHGVFCIAKWPDGTCTIQKFRFTQDYMGGGSFSQLIQPTRTMGAPWDISCKKVR